MNETHTQEPWRFSDRDWRNQESEFYFFIVGDVQPYEPNSDIDDSGIYSDTATAIAIVKGNATAGDIPHANARRIVAAMNACAGIPTEALEGGVVGQLLASLKAMLAWAVKDDDRCYDLDIPDADMGPKLLADVTAARAAIARANGGAA